MNLIDKLPFKILVRIYGAKDIPEKYNDRPLSVLFEFGKDKFSTSACEKPIPQWNEEAEFVITNGEDLKCPIELKLIAKNNGYFKEQSMVGCILINISNFLEFTEKKSHTLSKKGKKSSASLCFDISYVPLTPEQRASIQTSRARGFSIRKALDEGHHSTSTSGPHISQDISPEITGISPNNGPEKGETLVTIRGNNLGLNKEDILSLKVASVDCTHSVVYYSPHKITCLTSPGWGCGEGVIELKTASGGIGKSPITFRFNSSAGTRSIEENHFPTELHSLSKKDLLDMIRTLQTRIREKDEDIISLRQYIDKILLRVLEKDPTILEKS